jgi:hypothetical protein
LGEELLSGEQADSQMGPALPGSCQGSLTISQPGTEGSRKGLGSQVDLVWDWLPLPAEDPGLFCNVYFSLRLDSMEWLRPPSRTEKERPL